MELLKEKPAKKEKKTISARVETEAYAEFIAFVGSKNWKKADAIESLMVFAMSKDERWQEARLKPQMKQQIVNILSSFSAKPVTKKPAEKSAGQGA